MNILNMAVSLLLLLIGSVVSEVLTSSTNRCMPGMKCFPDIHAFYNLSSTLDGEIVFPNDPVYDKLVLMKNPRTTKFPFVLAVVLSTEDIQKCVLFVRKHNLRVTIQSSGHDYNGRSTGHGSFQIYLGNMTRINVTSHSAGEGYVCCESGTTLIQAYEEVDKHNFIMVGGNSGSVCMGGYTLGGGTSPLSRKYGMAVDNLLEVEMVTYDGRIVVANEQLTKTYNKDGSVHRSRDVNLFWALRGGGGGTFGIVTRYKFKLHPASPIVSFACMYPIYLANGSYIGHTILKEYSSILSDMPDEWGGYLLIGNSMNGDKSKGYILIAQNFVGLYSNNNRHYLDKMKTFHHEWQIMCQYANHTSFLEYIKTAGGHSNDQEYLVNTLMQNESFTDDWINFVISSIMHVNVTKDTTVTATGTLLGGMTRSVCPSATALHPGFRTALMSFTMSVKWNNDHSQAKENIRFAQSLDGKLSKFGDGMFPNNAGAKVMNWQNEFWGSNYIRLQNVKCKWDPENVFTCSQCVGSELSYA